MLRKIFRLTVVQTYNKPRPESWFRFSRSPISRHIFKNSTWFREKFPTGPAARYHFYSSVNIFSSKGWKSDVVRRLVCVEETRKEEKVGRRVTHNRTLHGLLFLLVFLLFLSLPSFAEVSLPPRSYRRSVPEPFTGQVYCIDTVRWWICLVG